MIYIPHIKTRLEELHPRWEEGTLTQNELKEFYDLLDEVVKEAREERSAYLSPKGKKPEEFLLDLLEKRITIKTINFFKYHPSLWGEESIENKEEPTTPPTLKNWLSYARQIARSIILGDKTSRPDRRKEVSTFRESRVRLERLLNLNYLWERAHRDWLLGQGKHKKKDFLERLNDPEALEEADRLSRDFDWDDPWKDLGDVTGDGFLIRDPEAQRVSMEHSLEFKEVTKDNPHWDEPTGYVPGYKPPETRDLLDSWDRAMSTLDDWRKGGIPEIKTEEECLRLIEAEIGVNFTDLKNRYESYQKEAPKSPNLILYIFGDSGKGGRLYKTLRQVYLYEHKIDPLNQSIYPISHEKQGEDEDLGDLYETFKDDINPYQDQTLIRKETEEEIKNILTPKQWRVFRERFINGKDIKDIASELHQTPRNIQMIIQRIRKRIKENMEIKKLWQEE